MLPVLISQLVVVLKDTAIGYQITFLEMVRQGTQVGARYGNLIPALIVTFVAAIAIGPWFAGVLSVGLFVGYSTLEIFRGATFGKTILGLKITNEDGSQPDRATLIKRWAIKNSAWISRLVCAQSESGDLS